MENMKSTTGVLADKALLNMLASDEVAQFSEAGLQIVRNVLAKVTLPSSLDHEILRKIFGCLRSWSSSQEVFSVIPLLANVYDNLVHRDLGQPNVSDSICKLLFLIEDMADHRDCKVIAGKHFLQRLLELAGSKLTGIKLQRVAVETLSSIILLCPTNQKFLLEDLNLEWHKLVKKVLPQCGDFFVQASIVEIFYRLSKRSSRLLDWLEDKKLRQKMVSLHQSKKPDLHAETRTFLDHLNQSLGRSRSVYSFLAKDIIFDGRSTPLKDEKWVHFGMDHMSFYTAMDLDSVRNSATLVDVIYTRICDSQICSNNFIEITFRESLPSGQDTWIQVKTIKLRIVLKPKELETIVDYVLPRINLIKRESQKGGSKEVDSENITTTPSLSDKIERIFRKASVGFAIPLPRKFKLPSLPKSSNEQVDLSIKAPPKQIETRPKVAEREREGQLPAIGNLQEQTQDEMTCKIGFIESRIVDNDGMKSSTRVFQLPNIMNQEKIIFSPACPSEEYKVSIQASKAPGPKQDKLSCSQAADNCKHQSPASRIRVKTCNSTPATEKIDDKTVSESRKDAVSNFRSNACFNTTNPGSISYAPRKSTRKAGSGTVKERDPCRLSCRTVWAEDKDAEPALQPENVGKASTDDVRHDVENAVVQWDLVAKGESISYAPRKTGSGIVKESDPCRLSCRTVWAEDHYAEPASQPENVDKASTDDVGHDIENMVQWSPVPKGGKLNTKNAAVPNADAIAKVNTKKAAVPIDDKVADTKQAEELQERNFNISKKAKLPQSDADDTRKQKNSTSDPIETDSEQNKPLPNNMNRAKTMSKKALSIKKKKPGNRCLGQEAGVTPRCIKRKSVTQLEKDERLLSKRKALQKDVFCFEEDQRCTTAKDIKEKLGTSEGKNDDYLAGIIQTDIAANSMRLSERKLTAAIDIKEKLFKVSNSKRKDDHLLANRVQTDTVANSARLLERKLTSAKDSEEKLFKIGNSNSKDDDHLAGLIQTDTVANSARWLETKLTSAEDSEGKLFKIGNSNSKDGHHLAGLLQTDTAANSVRLETTLDNPTGFNDACIFKSMCCPRQRKRELDIDRSPAKRSKGSPELAVDEALNDASGLQCSRFARDMIARFDCLESPKSGGIRKDKEDKKLHAVYSSPKETRKGQTNGVSLELPKLGGRRKDKEKKKLHAVYSSPTKTRKRQANGFIGGERRLEVSPLSASPAKHTPQSLPTCRRAHGQDKKTDKENKETFDVKSFLLNESVQTAETVDGDAMANGEMQLVAALVQKIMKKIKVKTENKSAQILSSAVEAVQQCCQEVQGKIQSDLDESTKLSRETFGQLQLQLQEEYETFIGTQKKWKEEFNNHLHRFKEISSRVDSSHSHLKGVSDKQKISHRKLFSDMNEFVELHLSETEQKLLSLQKGAEGLRNELKGALLQIF